MRVTLTEAFDMINRGETAEQYKARQAKLRRLANERDSLEDALEILTEPGDADKRAKKEKRLAKVLEEIERLK